MLKQGWINIQKIITLKGKQTITGYHTGADIHDSVEAAKRHASNNTIAQCKIEFTVK